MTKFEQMLSSLLAINASIISGSVIGSSTYASDPKTLDPSNSLDKYAGNTYLIVLASNSHPIPAEFENVSVRGTANNLSLNVAKRCEMIVRCPCLAGGGEWSGHIACTFRDEMWLNSTYWE